MKQNCLVAPAGICTVTVQGPESETVRGTSRRFSICISEGSCGHTKGVGRGVLVGVGMGVAVGLGVLVGVGVLVEVEVGIAVEVLVGATAVGVNVGTTVSGRREYIFTLSKATCTVSEPT
jgi:hypothetical protein